MSLSPQAWEEKASLIRSLHDEYGGDPEAVAAATGLHRVSICRWFRRLGLPTISEITGERINGRKWTKQSKRRTNNETIRSRKRQGSLDL